MNEIILKKKSEDPEYKIGSLFKDPDSEEVFILSRTQMCPNEYIAVSLKDGIVFNGICQLLSDAIQGLQYIGSNVKITID